MITFVVHPNVFMRLQNRSDLGRLWVQKQLMDAVNAEEAIYMGEEDEVKALSDDMRNRINELMLNHNWRRVYIYGEHEMEAAQRDMSTKNIGGAQVKKR